MLLDCIYPPRPFRSSTSTRRIVLACDVSANFVVYVQVRNGRLCPLRPDRINRYPKRVVWRLSSNSDIRIWLSSVSRRLQPLKLADYWGRYALAVEECRHPMRHIRKKHVIEVLMVQHKLLSHAFDYYEGQSKLRPTKSCH